MISSFYPYTVSKILDNEKLPTYSKNILLVILEIPLGII